MREVVLGSEFHRAVSHEDVEDQIIVSNQEEVVVSSVLLHHDEGTNIEKSAGIGVTKDGDEWTEDGLEIQASELGRLDRPFTDHKLFRKPTLKMENIFLWNQLPNLD